MLRLHRPFRLARSRASRVRHDEARALFLLCATVSFCTLAAHTMIFPRSSSFLKNVYDASAALGVALGALLSSMEPVGLENTPFVVPSAHDGELDHRELTQLIRREFNVQRHELSDEDIRELVNALDDDGTKTISTVELADFIKSNKPKASD